MDKEILVNKTKEVVTSLKKSDGDLSLFMLIANDPKSIDSNYTLLISAKWLDQRDPKVGINYIVKRFFDIIKDKDYLSYISRITLIKSDDNFVKIINHAMNVVDSDVTINNCNFGGIIIENAILFESNLASNNSIFISSEK